eukprot:10642505-Heterocapsa_arctica.AAC.1
MPYLASCRDEMLSEVGVERAGIHCRTSGEVGQVGRLRPPQHVVMPLGFRDRPKLAAQRWMCSPRPIAARRPAPPALGVVALRDRLCKVHVEVSPHRRLGGRGAEHAVALPPAARPPCPRVRRTRPAEACWACRPLPRAARGRTVAR